VALRGNLSTLRKLNAHLRTLPTSVAHEAAKRAAPMLTGMTREAFSSKRSVYGEARPTGKGGSVLSLRRKGDTERELRFVANGTIVRCVLGPKYARFLIGKYGILPNGAMPVAWSRRLKDLVDSLGPL
jgi:hypothetical protein